ncbi:MAG: hypothetical protein IKT52_06585 [Oscillospiraceae bacterium]|nr:hypothetical protein [Oscillospiraceae bacterium]
MERIIVLLCILLLLAGCGANVSESTTLMKKPETVLSHEMAMLEGYVVMDEGDVRHNAGNWFSFLKACEAGDPATVTVVAFTLEENRYTYVKYDLSFDGKNYQVEYENDGKIMKDSASELVYSSGKLDASAEPYRAYERYCLNDLILYNDLIAEPSFEGVNEVHLHTKEGEPPLKSYTGESLQPVLELLWEAEYVPSEPENYVYGMKLLMTNRDGKELVIELDLKQGYYRYGMQNYCYGDVSNMLAALGLEQWPDSVLEEFHEFLD